MAANLITNAFSVLSLDVEDDREETGTAPAAAASSKHENQVAKSDKKKDKLLENGSLPENDKPSSGILSSPSGEYKMPLVWIDLEMTGLDVAIDRILEIACVITSGNLTKSVEGPDLVIHQTKECLDNMGEWCREHHAASGLTKRVLQSTITEQDAEKQKYMPDLASLFPHVLVDVSSIKALCVRWFPRENKKAPSKENKHRAMDDIKESIRELKYYKENIFKKPKI
uniref:Oligoribonuclease n=1 Tax=Anthurium amnicola TaxID=1678845 RepID=A0A1D1ZIM0_9ARAE